MEPVITKLGTLDTAKRNSSEINIDGTYAPCDAKRILQWLKRSTRADNGRHPLDETTKKKILLYNLVDVELNVIGYVYVHNYCCCRMSNKIKVLVKDQRLRIYRT